MKRLMNWIAGIVSGVIAYRLWKKKRQKPAPATAPVATPPPVPTEPEAAAPEELAEPDERADELRAKLAEARATDEPAPAEPAEPAEQPTESVEERRRRVHEEGRAAIDRMNDN